MSYANDADSKATGEVPAHAVQVGVHVGGSLANLAAGKRISMPEGLQLCTKPSSKASSSSPLSPQYQNPL